MTEYNEDGLPGDKRPTYDEQYVAGLKATIQRLEALAEERHKAATALFTAQATITALQSERDRLEAENRILKEEIGSAAQVLIEQAMKNV